MHIRETCFSLRKVSTYPSYFYSMPTLPYFPQSPTDRISFAVTQVAPYAGYPSLHLPVGFSAPTDKYPDGLPIGMLIVGKPGSELDLLNLASVYQKRFGVTKVPWSVRSMPANATTTSIAVTTTSTAATATTTNKES